MAEFNDDDPIQSGTGGKWIWLGVIVVLAVAAVIIFLNADGDQPQLPDSAVTTTEERLNTDLTPNDEVTQEALEDVNGAENLDVVEPGQDAMEGEADGDIVTQPGGTVPAE